MSEPTTAGLEKLEEKIDKGEALSAEEEKLLNETADEKTTAPVEEEVDPEKITVSKDEDEKDSKTSDTPDEKDEESTPSKKESVEDAATKEAERKKLIEAEAEKPLDEADIKDYSPTERALFFELRKERRKRQDSQRETDTLRFQRAKEEARQQLERERAEAEAKAKAEKETDPFEGLEDDDLLTAGQIKKILAGKKEAPKTTPAPVVDERTQKLQMENWVLKAQAKIPDVLAVTKFADVYLIDDKIAEAEVADVVAKGGNPLIATYNYLKAHPKWPEIEAKLKGGVKTEDEKKKEEEARTNKERAERIEKNKNKPVTTGAGGGAPATGDYTIQEILEMDEDQFAKLPKSQRQKILQAL